MAGLGPKAISQIAKVVRNSRNQTQPGRQAPGRPRAADNAIGKLGGSLIQGGTATLSIYYYSADDEDWVDSGELITVHDRFLAEDEAVSSGKWCFASFVGGVWVALQVECET